MVVQRGRVAGVRPAYRKTRSEISYVEQPLQFRDWRDGIRKVQVRVRRESRVLASDVAKGDPKHAVYSAKPDAASATRYCSPPRARRQ